MGDRSEMTIAAMTERVNAGVRAFLDARLVELEEKHRMLLGASTTALNDIRDACGREGAAMAPSEVSQLAVERIAGLEAQLTTARHQAAYCADETKQALADLKTSREREAALAIRLRVIRNDHGCTSPTDEAWLRRNGYRELADALFSEDDRAILAAHDAEVRKPLEDRIAALEFDLAVAQKATKYQSSLFDRAIREQPEIKRKAKETEGHRLLELVRDHDILHARMSSDIFCRDLSLRDEYVERKAKVEALESVWGFLDYNSSIDQQVFLCDKFQAYIAALKAEGGKG